MPQRKITSKVSFIAIFEKGVIKTDSVQHPQLLKYEPTKIAVTVEPIGSTRSFNQVAYDWGHRSSRDRRRHGKFSYRTPPGI
jgi:hypothetical protein